MSRESRIVGSGITARQQDAIYTPLDANDLVSIEHADSIGIEQACLEWLDEHVCEVLAAHQVTIDDGQSEDIATVGAIVGPGDGLFMSPEIEEGSSVWYALKIRHYIVRLRDAMHMGDVQRTAKLAMALGVVKTEVAIKFGWEEHALRGAKTLASARRGHASVHGSDDEKQARWRALATDFRRERERGTAVMAAYDLVAERHRVSTKTVIRAVKRAG